MGNKGIYCIENIANGKRYIGSTNNIKKRKATHFYKLKRNEHHNIKLQRAFNKYGIGLFIFYIIEEIIDDGDLIIREQHYIDLLVPEYNINKIANSSLGVKRRPETIEKVRQANLGLKHPDWRNKIKSEAQGGDKHWTKKRKFSEKSKKKMSETHKKLYSDGYINPRKGKVETEAEKLKKCKPVLQYDLEMNFIKEWVSIKLIADTLNINNISRVCNGTLKSAGGFIWRFKNNNNLI